MPIISKFQNGGSKSSGIALAAVSGITTQAASGKVYIKWTDPEDIITTDGTTVATWDGTLLVRKAGSVPMSRRDGTVILDSTVRNEYANSYRCDSGLTNGVTYYYKLFPHTTDGVYTNSDDNAFSVTPTAQVSGIDDWVVTEMSASSEAGDGKMTIKWTDPAVAITEDGLTLATWESTTVVVKAGGYPTSKDDEDAVYTLKSTTRNQYASSALTVPGLTNGTTYYVGFFPETTDGGINSSTSQRTTGTANRITVSGVPSQSNTLTYTGNTLSPAWSNYNAGQLTLSGTTTGINAGSYNAIFTPTTDYRWSDGTTTAKTVVWTISKAKGSLTVSAQNVYLNDNATSATVTVTRAGDGVITATSEDTSIATVSVSGTTLIINSVNNTTGEVRITVEVAEGSNHTSVSESEAICVYAHFLPAVGTPLNDCTWDEIAEIASKGLASSYFEVGDCKAITLNGYAGMTDVSGTYYVYIIGFNHNGADNTIDFGTFKTDSSDEYGICLIDEAYNSSPDGDLYFSMNHDEGYGNEGGWMACDLRYDILGSTDIKGGNAGDLAAIEPVYDTLMAALPFDLRHVMRPMFIYTDNVGNGSSAPENVTESTDYLPLLAEFEVFGTTSKASNSNEQYYQKQYAYYAGGNRKQKKSQSSSSYYGWYERSPGNSGLFGNDCFCFVSNDGSPSAIISDCSLGIAPIFRV